MNFNKHIFVTLFILTLYFSIVSATESRELNDCKMLHNENNENIWCNICEFIVLIVEIEITSSNSTIVIIEDVIELVCKLIINPIIKQECLNGLELMRDIVKLIMNGMNPKLVCQKLKLCPST